MDIGTRQMPQLIDVRVQTKGCQYHHEQDKQTKNLKLMASNGC